MKNIYGLSIVVFYLGLGLSLAQMSGNYTLNKGLPVTSSNFQSFSALADTLVNSGISSNVIIDVSPNSGPYIESFRIGYVPGISSSNQVTINGNGESIIFSPSTSQISVVYFDSTHYLTIDSLNIVVPDTSAIGIGMILSDCEHVSIRGCNINTPFNKGFTEHVGICFTDDQSSFNIPTSGKNIKIENNTISGGYYGILINGSGSNSVNSTEIIANDLIDFRRFGIHISASDSLKLELNKFHRPTPQSGLFSVFCLYMQGLCNFNRIDRNEFFEIESNDTSGGGAQNYGVYFNNCDGQSGYENYIFNNLFYQFASRSNSNGFYSINSSGYSFINNTMSFIANPVSSTICFQEYYSSSPSTNVVVKNNIFSIEGQSSGTRQIFNLSTSSMDIDNNVMYIDTGFQGNIKFGQFNTSNFNSFISWVNGNPGNFDQNSVDFSPIFQDPHSVLVPISYLVDNIGDPDSIVINDILNSSRDPNTPDPGAYEFTGLTHDLGIVDLDFDYPNSCVDSIDQIDVTILNKGSITQSGINLQCNIYCDGIYQYSHINEIDSIKSFEEIIIAFDSIQGLFGTVAIEIFHDLLNDQFSNDDTAQVQNIDLSAIPELSGFNDTSICIGESIGISLAGDTSFDYYWFNDPSLLDTLNTGLFHFIPDLTNDTSFYVQGIGNKSGALHITEIQVGSIDQLEIQNTGTEPINIQNWMIIASDSYTDINGVNSVVQSLSGSLKSGELMSWTESGVGNLWGSNLFWHGGQPGWVMILDQNYRIVDFMAWEWTSQDIYSMSPVINGHTINVTSNSWLGNGKILQPTAKSTSLSRIGSTDNNNSLDFDTVLTTLGATNTQLTLGFQGNISGCPGPIVTLNIEGISDSLPQVTYNLLGSGTVQFNVVNSSSIYDYHWDFGDGNSTNGSSIQHTYQLNDTFLVQLTQFGLCDTVVWKEYIKIINVDVENFHNPVLIKVYPIPAKEFLIVSKSGISEFSGTIKFNLINSQGQLIKFGTLYSSNEQIEVNSLTTGFYKLVLLKDEQKFQSISIIIE